MTTNWAAASSASASHLLGVAEDMRGAPGEGGLRRALADQPGIRSGT
jgi:hypothetical protein